MGLEIFDGLALNSRTITGGFKERRAMIKKIYTELLQIKKELQTIRKLLEPHMFGKLTDNIEISSKVFAQTVRKAIHDNDEEV